MKRGLALCVALCSSSTASAVEMDVRCFGPAEGLPHTSVQAIAVHPSGYLLVATYAGVVAFDGARFGRGAPGLDVDFPLVEASALAVEPGGATWIGTTGEGVLRLDAAGSARWSRADGLPEDEVTQLAWLGDRVFVGQPTSVMTLRAGARGPAAVQSIVITRHARPIHGADDRWWLGASDGVLALGGASERWILSEPLRRIGPGVQDGDRLLFGRDDEIVRVPGGETVARVAGGTILGMARDPQGQVWVATNHGLFVLAGASLQPVRGLERTLIRSLVSDAEGDLWAGTTRGLCRLRKAALRTLGPADGLVSENVFCVRAGADGAVYAGMQSGGVARIAPGAATAEPVPGSAGHGFIRALQPDGAGVLRIGTPAVEMRWAGGEAEVVSEEPVAGLLLDDRGTAWKVSPSGRVERTRDGRTDVLSLPPDLRVQGITPGLRGSTLYPTRDGLYRVEGEGATRVPGITGEVRCAVEEADGTLFACGRGLWVVRRGVARLLDDQQGLPPGHIHAVQIDRHGDLWLSSNAGLFLARRSRLFAFLDHGGAEPFARLDVSLGMTSSELNGSSCPSTMTPDGRLWFAGAAGLVVLDPDMIHDRDVPLEPRVEALVIEGARVPRASWARLGPGLTRLRIEYTAVQLGGLGRVEFRHRLPGLDDSWQISDQPAAELRGLSPGELTFELSARLEGQEWSPPIRVALTLLPYWHQTRWARIGAVLLALSAVGLVWLARAWRVRAQRRRLERTVEERTRELRASQSELRSAKEIAEEASAAKGRFLAVMSHELRTPLNAIIGYSEMLEEDATGETAADLRKIHGAGKHLLTLINGVLDLSKIEAGKMDVLREPVDVAALCREVAATVAPLIQQRANTLEVACAPDIGEIVSDPTRLRQVLLNLLSNAAKFTDAGTVTLAAERRGPSIVFIVTDTGIGLEPEQLSRLFQSFTQADGTTSRKYGGTGLGLDISRRICRLLGGDIDVTSAPGRGSTFTVTLPQAEP